MRIPYQVITKFGSNPVGECESVNELIYLCPYCSSVKGTPDTKGHLYVNTQKLTYICHRCGSVGSVRSLSSSDKVRAYDQSVDYDDLIEELSSVLEQDSSINKYPHKIPLKKVNQSYPAMEYMINRGFTEEQLLYYDMRVGSINDKYFGRIIMPNQVEDLVYTDMYCARTYIDQTPKYKNPYSSEKSDIVFNLHRIPENSVIHICEGVLSAIAANKYAVASYGKYVSMNQISKILSLNPKAIYVSLDPDANKESIDLCNKLISLTEVPIYRVIMPSKEDPASLGHDKYMDIVESTPRYSNLAEELGELFNCSDITD